MIKLDRTDSFSMLTPHTENTPNTPLNRSAAAQQVALQLLDQVCFPDRTKIFVRIKKKVFPDFRISSKQHFNMAQHAMVEGAVRDAVESAPLEGLQLENWVSASRFLYSPKGKILTKIIRRLVRNPDRTDKTDWTPPKSFNSLITRITSGILRAVDEIYSDSVENDEQKKIYHAKFSSSLPLNLLEVVKKIPTKDLKAVKIFLRSPPGLLVTRSVQRLTTLEYEKRLELAILTKAACEAKGL